MAQAVGPMGSGQRFQRLKYVNRLYELRTELEAWQHIYLLQGKKERAAALDDILNANDKTIAAFGDFWRSFGS